MMVQSRSHMVLPCVDYARRFDAIAREPTVLVGACSCPEGDAILLYPPLLSDSADPESQINLQPWGAEGCSCDGLGTPQTA